MLDDTVARQDTVTMLVTQIRRARKLIPELDSVWVREHNLEPVDDANELVWAAEDLVEGGMVFTVKQADAVALLALVAGQDVEPGERWPARPAGHRGPESDALRPARDLTWACCHGSQFVARAVQEALARAQMVRALDELDDELGPVDPSVQDEVDELFAAVVAESRRGRPPRPPGKAASKGQRAKMVKAKSASASR